MLPFHHRSGLSDFQTTCMAPAICLDCQKPCLELYEKAGKVMGIKNEREAWK
jgi:hypothetical protein